MRTLEIIKKLDSSLNAQLRKRLASNTHYCDFTLQFYRNSWGTGFGVVLVLVCMAAIIFTLYSPAFYMTTFLSGVVVTCYYFMAIRQYCELTISIRGAEAQFSIATEGDIARTNSQIQMLFVMHPVATLVSLYKIPPKEFLDRICGTLDKEVKRREAIAKAKTARMRKNRKRSREGLKNIEHSADEALAVLNQTQGGVSVADVTGGLSAAQEVTDE